MRIRFSLLLCFWVAMLSVARPAHADLFALEPGKKIAGHEGIECNKCHTSGSGIAPNKCLGCHEHKPLSRQIRAGKGLHGRKEYSEKSCESCHQEHQGANFNPINWKPLGGQKRFSHKLTGYPLQGAHGRVQCNKCHTSTYKQSKRTKFLGLDQKCLSCHEDIHRFEKKHPELMDCKVCHTQDARAVSDAKGLPFDHGEVSKFPLRGKHNITKCANCHTSTKIFKMKNRPERCAECHQDPHENVYTTKKRDCIACHTDKKSKFTAGVFDHNKTKFKLRFKHARQTCKSCHEKSQKKAPEMSCISCHLQESAHYVKGEDRFKGRDCSQCHIDRNFKIINFNHNQRTEFPLGGKHAQLSCKKCHRVKSKRRAKTAAETFEHYDSNNCVACHAHKNSHDGKFNDRPHLCQQCHIPGSTNIRAPDHNELSPVFAQQGAHAAISCETCHGESLTRLKVGEDCSSCHKADDAHKGSLGGTCKTCHYEGYPWTDVMFDHNEQSSFALEGRHRVVSCTRCHSNAPLEYKPLETSCVSCHAAQDVHQGKLGNDCERCHDVHGAAPLFDHNSMTPYALEGAHARADCKGCHAQKDIVQNEKRFVLDWSFAVLGESCADCHGNPHGLRPGANCEGCHNVESFHTAAFRLGGGDDELMDAGPKSTGDAGTFTNAFLEDTPHSDGGPQPDAPTATDANADAGSNEDGDAGLSGTTDSRPARIDESADLSPMPEAQESNAETIEQSPQGANALHTLRDPYHGYPPFSLQGGHDRLECARCHAERGDLTGQGQLCDTCHRQDDVHAGSLGPSCADCHSVRAFAPAQFSHTQVGFTLVGAHRLVSCKNCHGAGNYMGISGDCVTCHLDDAIRAQATSGFDHAPFLTQPCINCHNQVTWLQSPFLRRRFP